MRGFQRLRRRSRRYRYAAVRRRRHVDSCAAAAWYSSSAAQKQPRQPAADPVRPRTPLSPVVVEHPARRSVSWPRLIDEEADRAEVLWDCVRLLGSAPWPASANRPIDSWTLRSAATGPRSRAATSTPHTWSNIAVVPAGRPFGRVRKNRSSRARSRAAWTASPPPPCPCERSCARRASSDIHGPASGSGWPWRALTRRSMTCLPRALRIHRRSAAGLRPEVGEQQGRSHSSPSRSCTSAGSLASRASPGRSFRNVTPSARADNWPTKCAPARFSWSNLAGSPAPATIWPHSCFACDTLPQCAQRVGVDGGQRRALEIRRDQRVQSVETLDSPMRAGPPCAARRSKAHRPSGARDRTPPSIMHAVAGSACARTRLQIQSTGITDRVESFEQPTHHHQKLAGKARWGRCSRSASASSMRCGTGVVALRRNPSRPSSKRERAHATVPASSAVTRSGERPAAATSEDQVRGMHAIGAIELQARRGSTGQPDRLVRTPRQQRLEIRDDRGEARSTEAHAAGRHSLGSASKRRVSCSTASVTSATPRRSSSCSAPLA